MALENLIKLEDKEEVKRQEIEELAQRIEKNKSVIRQYIAFWREYPDLFIDFLLRGHNGEKKATFSLLFYQRVFLRVSMRYKYVYCVFPRAYSKSFLSVMVQMIRALLYPGAQLFTTAGGKEQAAQILAEKVQDICSKIPAFNDEIDWSRGKTLMAKDTCRIIFKNGSTIVNVAARETSRGLRKHAGVMEECVGIDQDMLQQIIIPLMNIPRYCADGTVQEDEVLNQSQVYINFLVKNVMYNCNNF